MVLTGQSITIVTSSDSLTLSRVLWLCPLHCTLHNTCMYVYINVLVYVIVRENWPGRGQNVLNLIRVCQYNMPVDRLHYNLNVHDDVYTKIYQYAYRTIYCKNGQYKSSCCPPSSKIILRKELIHTWYFQLHSFMLIWYDNTRLYSIASLLGFFFNQWCMQTYHTFTIIIIHLYYIIYQECSIWVGHSLWVGYSPRIQAVYAWTLIFWRPVHYDNEPVKISKSTYNLNSRARWVSWQLSNYLKSPIQKWLAPYFLNY